MWKRAVCATAYAALEYYGDEPRFLDVMRTAKVYAEREVEAGHCAEIVWELMENHGGGVSDPDPAFDPKYCVGVVKGRAS